MDPILSHSGLVPMIRVMVLTIVGVMILGTLAGLLLVLFLDADTPDQRSPPSGSTIHGNRG